MQAGTALCYTIQMQKLLRRILLLILVIFTLNTLSTFFYWYYTIWWFDMPMHFLGGFFILLLTVFIAEQYLHISLSKKHINITVLERVLLYSGVALLAALLWEYLEIIFTNILGGLPFNILDTVSDLCFDISGILLACVYLYSRYSFFRSCIKVRYNMFVCQTGI